MNTSDFAQAMSTISGASGGAATITLNDGSIINGLITGMQAVNNQPFANIIDLRSDQIKAIALDKIATIVP